MYDLLPRNLDFAIAGDFNKGNSDEIWKYLKKGWPLETKSSHIDNIAGTSNPETTADIMNEHFASVGTKLAVSIPECSSEYKGSIHPLLSI